MDSTDTSLVSRKFIFKRGERSVYSSVPGLASIHDDLSGSGGRGGRGEDGDVPEVVMVQYCVSGCMCQGSPNSNDLISNYLYHIG